MLKNVDVIKRYEKIQKLVGYIPIKNLREKILNKYNPHYIRWDFLYKYYAEPNTLLKDNDKCLLIAPHPDDESIGCGGILYKHRDKFDCICVNSSAVNAVAESKNVTVDEEANTRISEFKKVMKKLEINNYWIYKICGDQPLMYKVEELFEEYAKVLDFKKYDYIFVPYKYDSHREHRHVANSLVPRLIKRNGYKKTTKIVYYEVWEPMANINYFEDISDYVGEKKSLISIYKSQIYEEYIKRMFGLHSYRGILTGFEYAEAYRVISINEYLKIKDDMTWNSKDYYNKNSTF